MVRRRAAPLHDLLARRRQPLRAPRRARAHYAKVVLDEVFGAGRFPARDRLAHRLGERVQVARARLDPQPRHAALLREGRTAARRSTRSTSRTRPGTCAATASRPGARVSHRRRMERRATSIAWTASRSCRSPARKSAIRRRRTRASSRASCARRRAPATWCSTVFVGSGTTAVVAEKLGRRWVACDASPIAIHTTRKRLMRLPACAAVRGPARRGACARIGALLEDGSRRVSALRAAKARRPGRGRRAERDHRARVVRAARRARSALGARAAWRTGRSGSTAGASTGTTGGPGRRLPPVRACGDRGRRRALPLSATHAYDGPGRYVALVKAFDVLGGATTKRLEVEVA